MKILIVDDIQTVRSTTMFSCDLVIRTNETTFDIVKNRFGNDYQKVPVELLPKVIKNPMGMLKMDWA